MSYFNLQNCFTFTLSMLMLVAGRGSVLAQGKVVEGYLVKPSGDTTKGFFRYESWDQSPRLMQFTDDSQEPFYAISCEDAREVVLGPVRYKCRTIGLLDIDLRQTYALAPSLEAKETASVFLREIVSGPHGALLEFLNAVGEAHYFLEKDGKVTELINYPFYKSVGEKKYLLTYDLYKKQLTDMLADAENFKMPLPDYSEKGLRKYIMAYNESFGGSKAVEASDTDSDFSFDVNVNVGAEGWKETDVNLKSRPSFGLGIRLNLPRRFHNRYFKVGFVMTPGASTNEVYGYVPDEKVNFKTIELGVGSYLGSGSIRPNMGIDYSFALDSWRSTFIGPHFGISYKRTLAFEIDHFANLNTVFTEIGFFNRPRLTLSYYLNLNRLFGSSK